MSITYEIDQTLQEVGGDHNDQAAEVTRTGEYIESSQNGIWSWFEVLKLSIQVHIIYTDTFYHQLLWAHGWTLCHGQKSVLCKPK